MARVLILRERDTRLGSRLLKTQGTLAAAGHQVELAALLSGDAGGPFAFRRALLRLRARVRRADVVHAVDYVSLEAARRLKARRIVFDACEVFDDVAGMSEAARAYVRRVFACARPDGVLVPNARIGAHFADLCPHWPAATLYRNSCALTLAKGRDLRALAGLPPETRVALFHGHMGPGRGLEALVEASDDLSEGQALVLMGYGPLFEDLGQRQSPRLRVIPAVPLEALLATLAQANIGLIPYEGGCLNHDYASPNKLYEYPAAGVPVAVAPRPVLAETVREWGLGWVGGSAEALLACLGAPPPAPERLSAFVAAHAPEDDAERLLQLHG